MKEMKKMENLKSKKIQERKPKNNIFNVIAKTITVYILYQVVNGVSSALEALGNYLMK